MYIYICIIYVCMYVYMNATALLVLHQSQSNPYGVPCVMPGHEHFKFQLAFVEVQWVSKSEARCSSLKAP